MALSSCSRRGAAVMVRWCCRAVLRIVGVRAGAAGVCPPPGALLVANHIGWIDILAVLSHIDCTVVAKREVGEWPVIGWLARQLGVVFVDRRRKRDLLHAIPTLTRVLAGGRCVLLFPEGTTGNGEQLLPFKSALLEAAVQARAPVVPIAVRASARSADAGALCWLGEETLVANVPRVRALRDARVSLRMGTPLYPGRCRKLATHRARASIAALLRGPAVTRAVMPPERLAEYPSDLAAVAGSWPLVVNANARTRTGTP